jgi:hypothetical protein
MTAARTISILLLGVLLLGASPPHGRITPLATSSWVFVGANDRLQYKTDGQGNRILDFSFAGYHGGGVALPAIAVAKNVAPVAGDSTATIQSAIDSLSSLPLDASGLRGAVLLAPGNYTVSSTLRLATSGVVLRGSGSGPGGTTLMMAAGAPFSMFSISGSGSSSAVGSPVSIADSYVPSGAMSFHVADASSLHVGDAVLVNRPVTQSWVHFMGMDTLTSTTGASQTWIAPGSVIRTDRTISAINADEVVLDAPLADSFDATYLSPPGGSITAYTFAGRISEVGVEHLQVIAPPLDVAITAPQYTGATLAAVTDAWLEDVAFQDTQNTVTIDGNAKRVTLDAVHVTHTVAHTGDRMADFGLSGTQIFVNQSSSDGTGEWPLVTQGEVSGPNVVLHFTSTQQAGIGPHQRWAVGLLTDNATLPNAPKNPDGGATGISYSDRGNHGSGQGWAMGWGVAWNVTTPFLVVQQPPGAQNWCIGCVGEAVTANEAGSGKPVPNGVFDSPGAAVSPNSLYLAQLCERLGPAALVNIGYSANDCAVPPTGASDGGADGSNGVPDASPDGAAGSREDAGGVAGTEGGPFDSGAGSAGDGGSGGSSGGSGDDGAGPPAQAAGGARDVAGGCACVAAGRAAPAPGESAARSARGGGFGLLFGLGLALRRRRRRPGR